MKHLQGLWAASLCASVVISSTPGIAEAASASDAKGAERKAYTGQIQGDERILHALNRFTFGPRPGDVEAVKAMGVDAWLEEQLHPAGINNTALQVRLADYPAMTWSPEDLLFRLPSNAVIRQVIDGKAPMPERGALYSVYENAVTRVSAKRQEKEQNKGAAATPNAAMQPQAAGVPTGSMADTAIAAQMTPATDAKPADPGCRSQAYIGGAGASAA